MEDILSQIDGWIKTIVANPYFGLIGFVVGILGLLLSYYVAKRDKRLRELHAQIISTNIVSKSKAFFPKLSIKYDNNNLENLTISKIYIKNTGTEVIKIDDIAKTDPISFGTSPNSDTRFLDFGITYSSDKLNNFRLENIEEGKIQLDFDYIEPKDNAVIQILHTGKGDLDIEINGTVIGSKTPFFSKNKSKLSEKSAPLNKLILENYRVSGSISLLFIILLCGIISYTLYSETQNIILSILCLLPAIFFAWVVIKLVTTRYEKDRDIMATTFMKSILDEVSSNIPNSSNLFENEENSIDRQ